MQTVENQFLFATKKNESWEEFSRFAADTKKKEEHRNENYFSCVSVFFSLLLFQNLSRSDEENKEKQTRGARRKLNVKKK